MDTALNFLIEYGYWGLLIASFLSASILPFSSEAVMVGLLAAGLDPVLLIVYGTIGNTGGSLFNYGLGRLGRLDWIERFLHVEREKLDKTQRWMQGRGAWMGFFAFVPVVGDVLTIAMGLMKTNFLLTTLSIFVGKLLRYVLLVYGVEMIL